MSRVTAIAACILWLPLASALADTSPAVRADGHALLAECGEIVAFLENGARGDVGVGGSYCLGMVNGMLNLNTIHQSQPQARPLFCLPRDRTVTNAEAARIVVNYLQAHPGKLEEDQSSLMFFAFQQAWPCP